MNFQMQMSQDSIRKAKVRIQYEIDTFKEKQNEAETIAMGSERSNDHIIRENIISVVAGIYTDIPKERIEKCYDYVWTDLQRRQNWIVPY